MGTARRKKDMNTRENKQIAIGESQEKKKEYLVKTFALLKKREALVINNKKTYFNQTELRMIGEILSAKNEGDRLISTQLAKLLGVTRSAVSQIVNRLEERGIVKRVPDDVDKKIAYIELTDGVMDKYGKDLDSSIEFVGNIVSEFGEEKFNTMCELFGEFVDLIERKI